MHFVVNKGKEIHAYQIVDQLGFEGDFRTHLAAAFETLNPLPNQ
jgi:hypothetical protein